MSGAEPPTKERSVSLRVERPERADRSLRVLLVAVLVVASVVAVLLLRAALTGDGPGHVSLTIRNATTQAVEVRAIDAGGSEVAVGGVAAGTTVSVPELVDIGDTWTFVARAAGREVWRSTPIRRSDLAARGWTVEIPAAAGAAPSTTAPAPTTGIGTG
jgi:hypothetical protein